MKYVTLLNDGGFYTASPAIGKLIPIDKVTIDKYGLCLISADVLKKFGCTKARGSDYPFTNTEYIITENIITEKDHPPTPITIQEFAYYLKHYGAAKIVDCTGISCKNCPVQKVCGKLNQISYKMRSLK